MASVDLPTCESPVLNAISDAFSRRSKAINHKSSSRSVTRTVEHDGTERLDIDVRTFAVCNIRLSVWNTNQMWFRACESNSPRQGGWKSVVAFHGDIARLEPATIIELLEESMILAHSSEPIALLEEFRQLWSEVQPYDQTCRGSE